MTVDGDEATNVTGRTRALDIANIASANIIVCKPVQLALISIRQTKPLNSEADHID